MIQSVASIAGSAERSMDEGVDYHSFSSVNTFASICQLQYRFNYVERLPRESIATPLVFGSGMNAALVLLDQDLIKGRKPDLGLAVGALRSHLEKAYAAKDVPVVSAHDETLEGLFAKGAKLLKHYVSELPADESPLEKPRRFTVPLLDGEGNALPRPLHGEVDRWIKTADGRIGIADWKTSSKRWTWDRLAKDDQATAYLIAGEHILGRKPDFFRYDLLLKTVKPALERYYVERTQRQRKRFLKKVTEVDRALKSGGFVPNDQSFACATCPFRQACDKWAD